MFEKNYNILRCAGGTKPKGGGIFSFSSCWEPINNEKLF